MGNLLASCFDRSAASPVFTSAASAVPPSFLPPHTDAINCVAAADSESFLCCSDDKTVCQMNASNGDVVKNWDVGYAVQRCWWGSSQLSLAADRGGRVTWLVDQNGMCQIGATCTHKLTVNALAADIQQV